MKRYFNDSKEKYDFLTKKVSFFFLNIFEILNHIKITST